MRHLRFAPTTPACRLRGVTNPITGFETLHDQIVGDDGDELVDCRFGAEVGEDVEGDDVAGVFAGVDAAEEDGAGGGACANEVSIVSCLE